MRSMSGGVSPSAKSLIAPLQYMLMEILLLRAIWKHNRALWPLTFAFHTGIYLIFAMLLFSVLNAILIIAQVPSPVLNVFLVIASVLAVAGYLLGGLGAIGLILKRALDSSLRPFNTFTKYFNLVFLGALFISGAYAWLSSADFATEMSLFIKGLITLDAGVTRCLSPIAARNNIAAVSYLSPFYRYDSLYRQVLYLS